MSRLVVSVSRRAVIGGAVAAVSGALTYLWPSVLRGRADPLDAAVAHLLRRRNSARTIGLAYLAVAPGEASIEALRVRLESFADAEAIAEQVRADFASGHVVIIDGWTMSLTEARACALVALT